MRTLIYGINYAPELTGIGKYSGEMAEWLVRSGHDVRVVTAPPYYPEWRINESYNGWRYSREMLNGVDVRRCPLWVPRKLSGIKRILHLLSFAFSSFPIMLAQIRWRPDVVLVVEPPLFCSAGALLVAKMSRAVSWLHVQDFEVDAAFDLGFVRASWLRKMVLQIERWLMRRFARVSTISPRMLEKLQIKGVQSSRCIHFPNWVDTGTIYPMTQPSPFRELLGIATNEIVLLYSGNMGQKQGLEMVIEAARLLQSNTNIRFVMCGQGAAYDRLRVMVDGLANMLWIPLQPMEQLNALLNLADIHMLPQRSDAADLVMPSKLTGILASGRPVIATAAEGTEVWSVVEGRGINTASGDVGAFVTAIRRLADDSQLRRQLGAVARRYAEERLGRDSVLTHFETQIEALIG